MFPPGCASYRSGGKKRKQGEIYSVRTKLLNSLIAGGAMTDGSRFVLEERVDRAEGPLTRHVLSGTAGSEAVAWGAYQTIDASGRMTCICR